MKKVLLVGSSFSAMPLLEELKKRAFHISVCGKYRTDPCHYYADNSFFVDYSKKEELLKICVNEAGKTINDSYNSDLPFSVDNIQWYSEIIDKLYDDISPSSKEYLFELEKSLISPLFSNLI